VGEVVVTPVSHSSASNTQSRCISRFAIGGGSSHPSTATPGGFAAATSATVAGSGSSPTSRSWKIRSIALDTDGADVVSSSKLINARSASAARRANAGGLYRTSPSTSIGRPRKSLASRIEPTTVSVWKPHAAA